MVQTSSPAPAIECRRSGDVRGLVPRLDALASAGNELRRKLVELSQTCPADEFLHGANLLMAGFEDQSSSLVDKLQAAVEETSTLMLEHET